MTIHDVKKIFFLYDCSLFAIAREEGQAYENYILTNISETTIEEWRQELFLTLWEQLKEKCY